MKKALYLFLTAVMISVMLVVVHAEEAKPTAAIPSVEENYFSPLKKVDALDRIVDVAKFTKYLASEFDKYNTKINISSFKIPYDRNNMEAIVALIREEMYEYFHVDVVCLWGYTDSNYTEIEVKYSLSKSEYAETLKIWNSTVDELIYGIKDNSALTEVQKALLIHDRIIVHCEYNEEYMLTGIIPEGAGSDYGVIIEKSAVCQGYAEAYKYLLDLVGIESYVCDSEVLNHAWNIVKIDGEWYHVDVTWDDPTWDVGGRVYHNYFLLSTNEFYKSHTANDYDTTPKTTLYDEYFWQDSNSEFQLLGGEIYYIDGEANALKTYSGKKLTSIEDKWRADAHYPGYTWNGNFSRLVSDGQDLYYSLSTSIYKYDIEKKKSERVMTVSHDFGDYFGIYGLEFEDGQFYCEFFTTPQFGRDTKELYTVTAKLRTKFTITAKAGDHGTISDKGKTEVLYGESKTYFITPDEGYEVKNVTVNGVDIGAVTEYTFDNVRCNQTISVTFTEFVFKNPFVDIFESDWYYEDVLFAAENGLMLGTNTEGTVFSPDAYVSRAMIATILWRLEGSPVVEAAYSFADVSDNAWYTNAVNWVNASGLMLGYGNGFFGTNDEITREQIVTILNRYAHYKGVDTSVMGTVLPEGYTYSGWAETSIVWASENGIFDGIGNDISDLTGKVSRAENTAYLRRFCENIVKLK